MQILTQRGGYITVHSVLSNVAKIHSRLPAAIEFWLVCLGIVVCEQEHISYCSLVISREVFFVSEGHRKPETYRANLCD